MIPSSSSRARGGSRALPALLACAVQAGCGSGAPRVEMPEARGPLALRVVHPTKGATVQAQAATYLIGSLGNGRATLSVNGSPVAVHRNGSFLAYLPLPTGDAPAYRLVAALGGDTVRRLLPVHLENRSAAFSAKGLLVVDTASLVPREPLRLRAEERVRVSVRAPANAEVWVVVAGGGRHLLRSNAPVPVTPDAARQGTARRRDPELWTVDLSAATLAGPSALLAARGEDTIRLPLPVVEVADPAHPLWVQLRTSAVGGAEREIVGRPSTEGEYRWFFLAGTRVEATGARGEMVRVRLDSGQEAWVAGNVVAPIREARSAAPRRAGVASLRPARDWVDLIVPLLTPPAYLVEQGERGLSLTLYGITAGDVLDAPMGDTYANGLVSQRDLRDRTRYTIQLSAAPYGYRAFWRDGAFVLRVRRPPTIPRGEPLRGLVFVVDPGHPPHGAVGPTGLREAEVTLQVARRLRRILLDRGARVVLTREGAEPVALEERTAIALRAGAHALVSIHADALADGLDPSRVNGTATFFFHPQSAPLAGAVQHSMVASMARQDRGFRRKNLAVVRSTWMPSVLCEGAMIIHPEEEAALRTRDFQEAYARGVAEGLENYFRALGEAT